MDGSLAIVLIHMYKVVDIIKYDDSFISPNIKETLEFLISYKKYKSNR
jgi:hypothetical protein